MTTIVAYAGLRVKYLANLATLEKFPVCKCVSQAIVKWLERVLPITTVYVHEYYICDYGYMYVHAFL